MVMVEDVEGGVLIKTDSDKGIRTRYRCKNRDDRLNDAVLILSNYTS